MDNILKFAVIAYLVHNNSQLKDYYDAIKLFNQIDEDENGKISKEELQYYLKWRWKIKKWYCFNFFNNIDTNHNSFIEYEEFIVVPTEKKVYFLKIVFNLLLIILTLFNFLIFLIFFIFFMVCVFKNRGIFFIVSDINDNYECIKI